MRQILIVDDTAFMRRILRDVVSSEGYELVGEARNGREAVELYDRLRPDVVLMDITMPELDGIAATREIVARDPAARVVTCSALHQEELVIEALEAGARDFVLKPFLPEKVLEALARVAGG